MGNTGDEGTLCGFAQLLSLTHTDIGVSVGSANVRHTTRVAPAFDYFRTDGGVRGLDPRRWWAKLRGTAHAVIGGTPIMDVLGAWPLCDVAPLVRNGKRWGVPFVFIGSGVEGLRLERSREIVRSEIAPHVFHWSVRSHIDRDRLVDYGISSQVVTVAADLAWLIEQENDEFGRDHLLRLNVNLTRPLVGINVANENSCFERYPAMTQAVARALDRLIKEQGAQVVFICSESRNGPTYDKAAAHLVMRQMKLSDSAALIPNEYFSPQELMSIISCCEMTISMRYHFCLFSALQGVPFIAIERADKVADLCRDLGWSARVVPPSFDAADLTHHAGRLMGTRSSVAEQLRQAADKMRDRALLNSKPLGLLEQFHSR